MNTNTATDVTAGTNATATQENNLRATILNGWYEVNSVDTLTYLSANTTPPYQTVTVPTDARTFYRVGMKIRYKQGGSYKYGYIIAVAATTLQIAGGSDYTITATGITNVAISTADAPYGFPAAFNFTPVCTGFSGTPSTTCRFIMTGNVVIVWFLINASASNTTGFTASLPVTVQTLVGYVANAVGQGQDSSAGCAVYGYCSTTDTTMKLQKTPGTDASWTGSGNKSATITLMYEA